MADLQATHKRLEHMMNREMFQRNLRFVSQVTVGRPVKGLFQAASHRVAEGPRNTKEDRRTGFPQHAEREVRLRH